MKNEKIDWDFKAVNPTDYEAKIEMISQNRLLLHIFQKSKQKLMRKNIKIKNNIDKIRRFDIEPKYLNLVKTFIRPVLKNMQKSCREDGIEILNSFVMSGMFEKNEEGNWKITLLVNGQYARK